MKTNYCTGWYNHMKKFSKILALLVLINIFTLPLTATTNDLEATNCKIVHLSGTVCRISADRVVTKLDSLKTPTAIHYLKSTDTIVTVDKASKAVLVLENVKVELSPRTKLHFKKITTSEKNAYILCNLIQGEVLLESSKSSKKIVNVFLDTRSSTIVAASDKTLKFSVTDTGKVTVQQGTVEIYALNDWTETNFMNEMLQRELLKSVTAGESGFFRYPSYPILKENQKDYSENAPKTPTREPEELPKNNNPCAALPVDNDTGKIQVEDKN